jgi:hypothetical protein
MAIVYIKQKKIQKTLILVFTAILLIIAFVVWRGFSEEKEEAFLEKLIVPREEVKIDFDFLKRPFLEELQPFSEIEPLGEEVGRENPFVPY